MQDAGPEELVTSNAAGAGTHKNRDYEGRACNQGIYPIYTVRFVASPMLGVNDKYFNKLYIEMAAANGFHSFAFVNPGWDVIVTVDVLGKKEISISYYEFDAPGAK